MAVIIARAVVPLVGGEQRIVLLGKDEEGHGYKLLVIQAGSVMDRLFDSYPDAFVRFLDYANCNRVLWNDDGVLSLEFPKDVEVEIKDFPPQDDLLKAWERIGGRIQCG
jgi:hypothetical protein